MNTTNHPRRAAAVPESAGAVIPGSTMGVRPGAGVLGLAKAEPAARASASAEPSSEGTLIVGEGIQVKGEIQSCTTLIVEGTVSASLEARQLSVRDGGLYDGTAEVESATIGGSVTGTLTVKGLLTVESGGRVSGKLRYRELKIEQGGRLSGDIDLLPEETPAEEAPARQVDPRDAAKAVSRAQAQGLAREPKRAEGAATG